MADLFRFADALGPHKIIHVHNPAIGLKAILVVDNVATGPSIGGLRMAEDVSAEECVRLARAMTLKNASAGLRHGGGKSVLFGDPRMEKSKKEQLIRAFACALKNEEDYIFGPDMGTDEECMAWVHDEIGRAVGLPAARGGIPLDEIGATGWGLCQAVEVAVNHCDFKLSDATLVIQGFGAVGKHAARFLAQKGVVLVGAADSRGTIHAPGGIDIEALIALKDEGKSVIDYPHGAKLDRDQVIDIPCDIWIPAARPDVIREANAHRLKAKLVAQGANIPFTHEAERLLHERGVLCLPDFIANAGGVICAAMEYHGASRTAAFETIAEKIRANTEQVLKKMVCKKTLPRDAALQLARQRLTAAMATRRWSIF
ncbi:MAG: Glu/Leu/Phe/Val dehydrogenase [Desulfobulbaceae bacterium]|nr:Glu/Leu/Phe/Val dehydrogenase [Desulfobulbaceae bacterium]